MPYTPSANATLLRRRNTGTAGPDLYNLLESYYEPLAGPDNAARTSNAYLTVSSDPTEFTLSSTIIVDRYCVAPGTSPFTEARVHRTGFQGAIATDFVDGVLACQIVCTVGVTLTATATRNGRSDLTATVTGASGPVLLSLDDFQTPGQPPASGTVTTYLNYRPGLYTVRVRETRPGGCAASASVRVTAAYGPRFTFAFRDADDAACVAEVFEREYTGPVEDLGAVQDDPLVLDWPGGATDHVYSGLVRGSQCQLALYLQYNEQLQALFSGDERLHRVRYSRAGALVWTGYLLPEQYDVAFLAPPTTFNLSATDGLGTLSELPFVGAAGELPRGDWSLLRVLLFCLGKLELDLPLNVLFNLYPADALPGLGALEQVTVDAGTYRDEKGKPQDCGAVLSALLTPFGARLMQHDGAWWLERLSELRPIAQPYAVYSPAGVRGADVLYGGLVSVQRPNVGKPHWLGAGQRQNLRPAVAVVTVQAEPGEPTNLLAFALPKNTDLPAPFPSSWQGNDNTGSTTYAQLIYQGKGKAPALRLVGTAGPVGGYSSAAARDQAAALAPWVQTPLTAPVPNPVFQGGPHNDEELVLRFRVKPYGVTPSTSLTNISTLVVALRFGDTWLRGRSAFPENATVPQIVGAANFFTADTVEAVVPFGATAQRGARPSAVRFYAPVGGASPCTAEITDIRLEYGTMDPLRIETITDTYTGDTDQLVSRQDAGTTITQSDTPGLRLHGSWLDAQGQPVLGWFEPATPGQLREVGDYLVRDRVGWQRNPAQVLSGVLRGQLAGGPGALLTDPTETRPAVYAQSAVTHHAYDATWVTTAVQLNNLNAPGAAFPSNAIAYDDGTVWADEDGRVLTYDNLV